MELIYEEVLAFAARGPEEAAWTQAHLSRFYDLARHWRGILAAAVRGEAVYEAREGEKVIRQYLQRLKEELAYSAL